MKIPVYLMNIRETFKKEDCGLVSSGLSGGLKNSVSGWVRWRAWHLHVWLGD